MIINEDGFFILDIGSGYELKHDPYREHNHWTLLRGGRVLDGDFMDVVIYLYEKEILGWKARKPECPICKRIMLDKGDGTHICIKCDWSNDDAN